MRIISGKARGTKLYTLEGYNTIPTLDRVRESVFNIIQSEIPESVVLDLFSGSGAVGLEFASRGAKKVYMCDNSKKAIEIIKSGGCFSLFPQGTRLHIEPQAEQAKKGVGFICAKAESGVLPVGIYTKDYKIKLFRVFNLKPYFMCLYALKTIALSNL